MIAWERRHNNADTELIVKYDGFVAGGSPPPADCCILLETGAPDEILLEDSGCIQPQDC